MKYVYIDGDDIGLRIEKCFMANNEIELNSINKEISNIIERISSYLEKTGCVIIFNGADGIIFKHENPDIKNIYYYIKSINSKITFSIGIGNSLRETFLALRYMKANGKNGVATLNKDFELLKY